MAKRFKRFESRRAGLDRGACTSLGLRDDAVSEQAQVTHGGPKPTQWGIVLSMAAGRRRK